MSVALWIAAAITIWGVLTVAAVRDLTPSTRVGALILYGYVSTVLILAALA